MGNAFVNLSFALVNRFAHFQGHSLREHLLSFIHEFLDLSHFFKTRLKTVVSELLLVNVALIGTLNSSFDVFGINEVE